MYTKFLVQGAKFGSGPTGLDKPAVECTTTSTSVLTTMASMYKRSLYNIRVMNAFLYYY